MKANLEMKPVLSEEQVNFYRDNGYLVVENVVSRSECDHAIAMYEKYAKPDYRAIMNLYRGIIEYVEGGMVEYVPVDPQDAEFELSLVEHYPIPQMLEDLQLAEVGLLQTMLLFKKVGTPYQRQSWNPHQDNAYPQAVWGAYITGNICFTDQDPENGCLRMYPGSHREFLLDFEAKKSFHENVGDRPGHKVEVPPQYSAVDLPMKKGSVLFLHGNVIHDSYPNVSPTRSRQMLLIPYITACVDFIPGGTAKRTYRPLRKRPPVF